MAWVVSARRLPVVQAVCQCAKAVDNVVRDSQFFWCKIRHRLWDEVKDIEIFSVSIL